MWNKCTPLKSALWLRLSFFFSCLAVSDSLPPHGLQHAMLLCPFPSPPALSFSQHQDLFQWVGSSHQMAKILELQFQFQHQSFQYSGLTFYRIDWYDLLAVQGTLKTPLQHDSLKASILQRSAFFIVQLSHPYMTTGKTIALNIWNFVCKVMSLLFNMLSRFLIAFFPKSKCLFVYLTSIAIENLECRWI